MFNLYAKGNEILVYIESVNRIQNTPESSERKTLL